MTKLLSAKISSFHVSKVLAVSNAALGRAIADLVSSRRIPASALRSTRHGVRFDAEIMLGLQDLVAIAIHYDLSSEQIDKLFNMWEDRQMTEIRLSAVADKEAAVLLAEKRARRLHYQDTLARIFNDNFISILQRYLTLTDMYLALLGVRITGSAGAEMLIIGTGVPSMRKRAEDAGLPNGALTSLLLSMDPSAQKGGGRRMAGYATKTVEMPLAVFMTSLEPDERQPKDIAQI